MDRIKEREKDSHKGNFGKILIIAGSPGMAGAAVLCAKGALRSGAGLVRLSIPESIFPVLQISVPEAICQVREGIPKDIHAYDMVIFGPGIGTGPLEQELLKQLLRRYHKKILLDADGLNLLAQGKGMDWLKESEASVIITPHPGEARRLLRMEETEAFSPYFRQEAIKKLYEITGAVVVLKGHETMVYDGITLWTNSTGNPGMATAGSGDVLSGIIGSFWGQGYGASESARLGVYIHGLAGDMARDRLGEYGLMAGDLCEYTPYAIKKIMEDKL